MNYNECRIRNVDAGALAKIDQLAEKKGMSRNALLKTYIENLAMLGELKDMENKYDNLATVIITALEIHNEKLDLLININRNRKD